MHSSLTLGQPVTSVHLIMSWESTCRDLLDVSNPSQWMLSYIIIVLPCTYSEWLQAVISKWRRTSRHTVLFFWLFAGCCFHIKRRRFLDNTWRINPVFHNLVFIFVVLATYDNVVHSWWPTSRNAYSYRQSDTGRSDWLNFYGRENKGAVNLLHPIWNIHRCLQTTSWFNFYYHSCAHTVLFGNEEFLSILPVCLLWVWPPNDKSLK